MFLDYVCRISHATISRAHSKIIQDAILAVKEFLFCELDGLSYLYNFVFDAMN